MMAGDQRGQFGSGYPVQPPNRGLAAAAALVSASSWPLPIMVTSMGAPAIRPSAAPMTGVPCSGVYRP